jgi:hypothetical protein
LSGRASHTAAALAASGRQRAKRIPAAHRSLAIFRRVPSARLALTIAPRMIRRRWPCPRSIEHVAAMCSSMPTHGHEHSRHEHPGCSLHFTPQLCPRSSSADSDQRASERATSPALRAGNPCEARAALPERERPLQSSRAGCLRERGASWAPRLSLAPRGSRRAARHGCGGWLEARASSALPAASPPRWKARRGGARGPARELHGRKFTERAPSPRRRAGALLDNIGKKQVPRFEHAVARGQEGPYRGESCPGPPHRRPCHACVAPWFLRWR